MEQKNIQLLILAFVFLVVGSALIVSIASSTNAVVDKNTALDESHDISGGIIGDLQEVNESNVASNITVTYAPSGWKINDCPLTNVVVENSSAGTYTALSEGTDYNLFASTGIIQMLNTTKTDGGDFNTTYVSYTYCGDDYLNSSWGRAVITTVPGFFALALLGVSLWLFYSVFRSIGIIRKV